MKKTVCLLGLGIILSSCVYKTRSERIQSELDALKESVQIDSARKLVTPEITSLNQALSKLRIASNAITVNGEDVYFLYSPLIDRNDPASGLIPYIQIKNYGGPASITVIVSRIGKDPLYFNTVDLSNDEKTIKMSFYDNGIEKESIRGNDYSYSWKPITENKEHYGDVYEKIEENGIGLLCQVERIAEGKNPQITLSGKAKETRSLSANEIQAFKDILAAYEEINHRHKRLKELEEAASRLRY